MKTLLRHALAIAFVLSLALSPIALGEDLPLVSSLDDAPLIDITVPQIIVIPGPTEAESRYFFRFATPEWPSWLALKYQLSDDGSGSNLYLNDVRGARGTGVNLVTYRYQPGEEGYIELWSERLPFDNWSKEFTLEGEFIPDPQGAGAEDAGEAVIGGSVAADLACYDDVDRFDFSTGDAAITAIQVSVGNCSWIPDNPGLVDRSYGIKYRVYPKNGTSTLAGGTVNVGQTDLRKNLDIMLRANTDYRIEFSQSCSTGFIRLPYTFKLIGAGGSTQAEVLNLPESLSTIESEAFMGDRLESVHIPESCHTIAERAFANCASLRDVYFCTANADIASDAFAGDAFVKIHAPAGGSIETWASEHGIPFVETQE